MSTLDFNNITNKEIDSYNRLLEHEQNIKKLQSDKIEGESPSNREKRREYIKLSKNFKQYKEAIKNLVDKYEKALFSDRDHYLVDINNDIEIKLRNIEVLNEETQNEINELIKIS